MSDGTHLLIPFASSHDEGCLTAVSTLGLPNLEKLLARLETGATDRGDEASLSMPRTTAPRMSSPRASSAWAAMKGAAPITCGLRLASAMVLLTSGSTLPPGP